jgi:membrane dipeptidase
MRYPMAVFLLGLAPSLGAQPRATGALLIDTHNDVTSRTVAGLDLGKPAERTHTDLPRLRQGGVGAVFFAAYVSASYARSGQAAHRALEMIDTIRRDIAEAHPDEAVLALSARDIEAAHKSGKLAVLIGVEGGHAIENSLRLLRDYYALGARYMTLTHVNSIEWADSSGDIDKADVPHHNGLTDFGRGVVAEMNRLGMAVDVSHVSDKTFFDVLATSRAPVFASHSSCRALADIPRNMTDEMIVAMAKKGGVIQINFGCEFLAPKSRRAQIADVVAHIGRVVKLAGLGAVGIGTDYDGVSCVPEGLEDVSKFPALTRALLEAGYSAPDVAKIYGGNTLRFLRAVEQAKKGTDAFSRR